MIKSKAFELGFDLCGVAPVRKLEEHIPVIRNWVSDGMNGQMSYLGRDIEKRTDPSLLFPGAKSVIVTGLNYFTNKKQGHGVPLISKYAYGADYHDVVTKKLEKLLKFILSKNPEVKGKSYVDSSPILEKAWAMEAGLGWPGRHSVIINKEFGSFFFIGILLVDKELLYDNPFSGDYCENCRICIESCPTVAINENRTIDSRKCISYYTIEHKGEIPENITGKMENRVFGCDICQDVCPWNNRAKQHKVSGFDLSPDIERMEIDDWLCLTEDQFNLIFERSPVKRRKYRIFMHNLKAIIKT
jgi:epoxyqueuosine reductase